MAHALPAIGVTTQTYYRWCKGYGGTSVDQADRLRALEKDSQRLRQALSGLTFGKQILEEAAKGNAYIQRRTPRMGNLIHAEVD